MDLLNQAEVALALIHILNTLKCANLSALTVLCISVWTRSLASLPLILQVPLATLPNPHTIATPSPAAFDLRTLVQSTPKVKLAERYNKEVLKPLHEAQKAAEALERDRLASEARLAEEALRTAQKAREAAESARRAAQGAEVSQPSQTWTSAANSFSGAPGYALPYGNCVDEPGVNNPGWGNPSDWPITSNQPWIGASAIFWYNHVAVVSGIWPNGDVEVRHRNWRGIAQTRFPKSIFRGFR